MSRAMTASTSVRRLRRPAGRLHQPMELSYVTAGESHGPGLTVVISGLPAGLELDHGLIRADLARRQAGYGRSPRQKLEQDDVDPRGGLRHGKTLGSPLAFFIENRDHKNWTA